MLMSNTDRPARLHYMANGFRVLAPGDHVVCAVSGERLALRGSLDPTGGEVFVTDADGDVLLHSTFDPAGIPPVAAVGGDGVEVEVSDPSDAWCRRMGLGQ